MTGRPSLTNDEQLWLMKQVKMSCMTVDEAVSWTEARTNEIQLEEETNNISKEKKSFKPGKTLKKFLPRRSRNKSSEGNNASIVRKPVERSSVSSEEHVETSGNQDLRSKQVYNFSIYKCSKHKVPQKRIMQIDFGAKVISLIHHGNLLTNYPFSSLVNVDGQEGKKVFIYFDDSQELELNAENLADKTKLIRLLNVISEQNEYEERGQPFDPCEKLQLSFKIIKEGYLEKKGAYSAINWNKRLVVIRSGELAYYRVEEEEQTAALNIINLSPGSIAINPEDSNTFTIATTKDSYRFRIPESSASNLQSSQEQIRDEWIAAIHEGCKRSYCEASDSGEDGDDAFDLVFQELKKIKASLSVDQDNEANVENLKKLEELWQTLSNIQKLTTNKMNTKKISNGEGTLSPDDRGHKVSNGETDTLLDAILNQNQHETVTNGQQVGNENPYESVAELTVKEKRESKTPSRKSENLETLHRDSLEVQTTPVSPSPSANSRPHSAVSTTTMDIQGIPLPPPPPPLLAGVPPPPGMPPPPPLSSSKSKYQMRPFHWTPVPKAMIGKSMWKNIEDLQHLVDQEELHQLFQVTNDKKQSDVTPIKTNEKPKKRATESFLDRKTAQNLGIFLAGFKLRGDELIRRVNIVCEEDGGISTAHLNGLYKVCPEPELKALYEKEIERKDDFSKEDRFMMELCQIPRLGLRLEALTIIRELPQEIEDLQPAVELALNSLEELSNSQLLEKSLAYILAVANQINCTNAKGTAKGIRLSSLQKTCVMRTNDRKQTLLNVVVDIVEKHEPEVLQLADELKSLTKSQAYSTKGLSAEIDIMRKSVFKVRKNCELLRRKKHQPTNEDLAFCNGVEAILTELDADIKQLNDKCVEIKKTLSRVLLKFGESSETDTQDLFSWIREFISNFKKTSL